MTDDVLTDYITTATLVSIKRESIAPGTLQAFPVSFSESLLCVWYVRDFLRDGYLILRRHDISSIEVRATDSFQRELIRHDGLLPAESDRFPLDSFATLLGSLDGNEIAIVECESLEHDEFTIGRYVGCDEDGFLAVHEFSGAANWDDDLTKLDADEITCVQLRSNYILPYQNYFNRVGFPDIPRRIAAR